MSNGSTHSRLLCRRMATNTICTTDGHDNEPVGPSGQRARRLVCIRTERRIHLGDDIGDGGGAYDDAVLVLEKYPCVDPGLRRETKKLRMSYQECQKGWRRTKVRRNNRMSGESERRLTRRLFIAAVCVYISASV